MSPVTKYFYSNKPNIDSETIIKSFANTLLFSSYTCKFCNKPAIMHFHNGHKFSRLGLTDKAIPAIQILCEDTDSFSTYHTLP